MQLVPIANLRENERAYLLDTGELVAILAHRGAAPDPRFVTVVVRARLIDADGETVTVGSTPVEIEPRHVSVGIAALASGGMALVNEAVDRASAEAATAARELRAGMEAWTLLPAAPSA